MARTLTVNGIPFQYPDPGEPPVWGEGAADWAEEVTKVLDFLFGSNDIIGTSFNVLDDQTTFQDVIGLTFDQTQVRSFVVNYNVFRTDGNNNFVESGQMWGNYTGSDWQFSIDRVGDAGMTFDITSNGQVQYKSSSIGGTYDGVMIFQADAIDKSV